jgi:hypothetical protein
MKTYGEWKHNSIIINLGAKFDKSSASRLDRFTPVEKYPSTHRIGGSVGTRAVWMLLRRMK